ncbi:hypothetical protein D3C72_2437940 [compost metagenome]
MEILLRPDFLPAAFYEYMDKGRRGVITDAEIKDFAELREALAKRAIELPENELLEIIA